MPPPSLNIDQLPGFIYLIDAILKDSEKTEENIYKEIAAWDSPEEKTRDPQSFSRAFKLRSYLQQTLAVDKKHNKPSIVTLNILASYYSEGAYPKYFKDFLTHYQEAIQAHYEINKPLESIIDSVFKKRVKGRTKEDTTDERYNNENTQISQTSINPDSAIKKSGASTKTVFRYRYLLFIITPVLCFLLYKGSSGRTVEITSKQEKEIIVFLIKKDNQIELGKLTKENQYQFNTWLSTGKTELYYYSLEEPDGKEYPGAEIVEILPFWESMPPVILSKI